MNLKDFPGGRAIFVDANIFVLHLTGPERIREECRDFLRRIENGEIQALTANFVLDEVIYSLLITKGGCVPLIQPASGDYHAHLR